ncbi:MAG: hypothetical protein RLY93_20880 [Sumerlaeia bacterium]
MSDDPRRDDILARLSRSVFMRESQGAARAYQELLDIAPGELLKPSLQFDLARLLELGNEPDLALNAYEKLIVHMNDHPSWNVALRSAGHLCQRLKRNHDCRRFLEEFLKTDPNANDRRDAEEILKALPDGHGLRDPRRGGLNPQSVSMGPRSLLDTDVEEDDPEMEALDSDNLYILGAEETLSPSDVPGAASSPLVIEDVHEHTIAPSPGDFSAPIDQGAPPPPDLFGGPTPGAMLSQPGSEAETMASPPNRRANPPARPPAAPRPPVPPSEVISNEGDDEDFHHVEDQGWGEDETPMERFYRLQGARFALLLPPGQRIRLDDVAEALKRVRGMTEGEAKTAVVERKGLLLDRLSLDDVLEMFPKIRDIPQPLYFVAVDRALRPHKRFDVLKLDFLEPGMKLSTLRGVKKARWEHVRLLSTGRLDRQPVIDLYCNLPSKHYRLRAGQFSFRSVEQEIEMNRDGVKADPLEAWKRLLICLRDRCPEAHISHTVENFFTGRTYKPQKFSSDQEFDLYNQWLLYARYGESVDPEELIETAAAASHGN